MLLLLKQFSALNVQTGEEVAIKLEHTKAKHPQLHIECKFYRIMQGGGKFSQNFGNKSKLLLVIGSSVLWFPKMGIWGVLGTNSSWFWDFKIV